MPLNDLTLNNYPFHNKQRGAKKNAQTVNFCIAERSES